MPKTLELQQKRSAQLKRMREINDAAEETARDLTAEERTEYGNLETEFESLGERIKRESELEARELELEQRSGGLDGRLTQASEERTGNFVDTPEYRKALVEYLRQGEFDLKP